MHLSDRKTRLNRILALFLSLLVGAIFAFIVWEVQHYNTVTFVIVMVGGAIVCFNLYSIFTKKYRERNQFKDTPFPENWRKILQDNVAFYRTLSAEDKKRFETEILIFLHETRVTGIKTEVDDLTLVLAAASAEIPVFGFPDWEYPNLGEILIYPGAFTKDFRTEGEGRNVWGMVGTGLMEGVMILSKPALIGGFRNTNDKQNVGIHEFAHLIDAADGEYDGIPKVFLQNQYILPWIEAMAKEKKRIDSGESKMNPYGGTSPVEFFAVAAEYFFEHPEAMKKNKPELYELLTRIFQQDTRHQFVNALKDLFGYTGKKINRNQPCPCGSGKKYKDCCLNNARQF